jgi:hypothetical protein
MRSFLLLCVLLLCAIPPSQAQTTSATLAWDEPTSTPMLPGGARLASTLWRRGAAQGYYQHVRGFSLSTESYDVAVPQDVGSVCYRVQVWRTPMSSLQRIDTSDWAEVDGYPGCKALCLCGERDG